LPRRQQAAALQGAFGAQQYGITMLKRTRIILAMILTVRFLPAVQQPKPDPPQKHVLTEEEREILKNRDILENLDLLQDLEKFRLFDLFAGKPVPDANKDSKKPATGKDGKKAK
jgi:hypothetical protein